MVFTKHLRPGITRGRIRCSVRIWIRPQVKVGGRYQMDEGHIVVDSIDAITLDDVTYDLARESGFDGVEELLQVARHGRGDKIYLIRFHYLPPGAWDVPARGSRANGRDRPADGRRGDPDERAVNSEAVDPVRRVRATRRAARTGRAV